MKKINALITLLAILLLSMLPNTLTAANYGYATIEESIVPGGYELLINTRESLVLLSHFNSLDKIEMEVGNYSSMKIVNHKVTKIPFIESITIERLSDKIAAIKINTTPGISYKYLPVFGAKSLKIRFEGDVVTSIATEYYEIGEKYRFAGNYPAALESYRTAVRLSDGIHTAAYFGIGLIRKEKNQDKLAIGSFKNTLDDDDLKNEAHLHLSQLFEKIGKNELSQKHLRLSNGDSVSNMKNLTVFLSAVPEEVPLESRQEISVQEIEQPMIKAGSFKSIFVVMILLSPFAILLLAARISAKKSKNSEVKESFKMKLEESFKSTNITVGESKKGKRSKGNIDKGREDILLNEELSKQLLQSSLTDNIKQKRDILDKINNLLKQNYTAKQIAQDLYMSESEVKMILGIGGATLNNISNIDTSLGRISKSPLKAKELSKELHRNEEELSLELLVHDRLNE